MSQTTATADPIPIPIAIAIRVAAAIEAAQGSYFVAVASRARCKEIDRSYVSLWAQSLGVESLLAQAEGEASS